MRWGFKRFNKETVYEKKKTMSDTLTDLPGVGTKTAKNLKRAGFDTKEKIGKANVRRLSRINGIGQKGSKRIIEAAGGGSVGVDVDERREERTSGVIERIEQASTEKLRSAIKGSGPSEFTEGEVQSKKIDGMENPSPFTIEVTGPRRRTVESVHQSRSERAQDVDEQQNAPVTTDEEKWLQNPDRFDFPGVDTIPAPVKKARAEKAASVAQEKAGLDKVQKKGRASSGLQGKFSPEGRDTYGAESNVIRVQENAFDEGQTLAHEVGHAFDFGTGEDRGFSIGGELLGLEDESVSEEEERELFEEAKELSKRARGGFGSNRQYRTRFEELTADALGQSIIEPRAAQREAPKLFDRATEIADREGIGDAISSPLEAEPERKGFLD